MYPLTLEKVPKYLFGNLCYQTCPSLTKPDEINNLCKCIYAWEQNSDTNEITCYNKKKYCLSNNYYYHTDTKECVPNNCKENYYQFNFRCYKNGCPDHTINSGTDEYKCLSTYNYCHINENFENVCNENQEEYFKEDYLSSGMY